MPVPTAVSEATAQGVAPRMNSIDGLGVTRMLPLSILLTSVTGIARLEYGKKGEVELSLAEGDSVQMFKQYNHWSYVHNTASCNDSGPSLTSIRLSKKEAGSVAGYRQVVDFVIPYVYSHRSAAEVVTY
ncbi:hypothetical protein NM688_g1406 [Phlebia brevispora]|uniref:Uncharacterized protein n=1 Tax=Phlebia brevispora TaxID=194682 RepID=A0ACC1TBW9_9APHY|nr:hypothetical protein NM688_g1406 [Phlebia brevispora]